MRIFADGAAPTLLSDVAWGRSSWLSVDQKPISIYLQGGKKKAEWAGSVICYVLSSSLYSQDTLGARQRHLTARRLNAEAKIIESHTQKKHKLIIVAPNTSHTHTHSRTAGPPLRADLAMPPTAQCWRVSRTNWASLRREQRRPEAVLLSRRRGGGRLPVVSRCRSFWERCHTRTNRPPPPPPLSSHQPASGFRARVHGSRKERHSYDQAAGLAVLDELILDGVQRRGEPERPWRLRCLREVTVPSAAAAALSPQKQSVETLWGSTEARVMTGRGGTS